jgi:hypothetical protein
MITVITGLTGSGKTWLMTRLMLADWKVGAGIYSNFPLYFPNDNERVTRFHQLDELYRLVDGVIAIDEGQKLFDARRWGSLPISFAEKIAQHRKHHLDIYTTTQDFAHIDVRIRQNVHELYSCQSLFRFPQNDRDKPLLQIIRVIRKSRKLKDENERINWVRSGRAKFYFISRYWTNTLYNTYGDIGFDRFITRIKYDKKKWVAKIYSRDLINQGKARI